MAYSSVRRRPVSSGRPIVIHVTVPAARPRPVRRSAVPSGRRVVVRMPMPAPRRRYY